MSQHTTSMSSSTEESRAGNPVLRERLVRLHIPAPLLRAVDIAVIRSSGAYRDRDEFIAEAIRDRLTEDGIEVDWRVPASASEPQPDHSIGSSDPERIAPAVGATSAPDVSEIWTWSHGADTGPQMPRVEGLGANWGLHNRDIGSLWALDLMMRMAVGRGDAVPWQDFVSAARTKAQEIGRALRLADQGRTGGLKLAVGFPKDGPKQRASEERFVAGSLGAIGPRINGPLFILGLAGASVLKQSTAPTQDGAVLLRDLLACGLSFDLPQPAPAARRWWKHLASCPPEFELWVRTLELLEGSPTRAALLAAFPEWPGSQADTNTMGLVSRLREWGLLEPQLNDGRYSLTDTGREFLRGVA